MKNYIILAMVMLVISGCQFSDQKNKMDSSSSKLPYCSEMKNFPTNYSFIEPSDKEDLLDKKQKALTNSQRAYLFSIESEQKSNYSNYFDSTAAHFSDFEIFPLEKITYPKATAIIYLANRKKTQSSNSDELLVVLYDNEEMPADMIRIELISSIKNSSITKFSSSSKITVANIGFPDGNSLFPNSEVIHYYIDPIALEIRDL